MSCTPSTFIRRVVATVAVVVTMAFTGCSGDDDGDGDDADVADDVTPLPEIPARTQLSSPVDDTPFCRTMLDLGTEGDGDPDGRADIAAVLDAYLDVVDDVPSEIRPDFDVVLDHIGTLAAGGEVDDPAGAEESAIALAAFVELHCRGTNISPLPPPTSPLDGVEITDD